MKINDIVKFNNYKWRVLTVQDSKALIITEKLIEARRFHEDLIDTSWEECDLRHYLNGTFYDKFTESEKGMIIKTTNKNPANPWWGLGDDRDTEDNIFLLSLYELVEYFGDSGDLRNRKGWRYDERKRKFIYEQGVPNTFIHDDYNRKRIAKFKGRSCCWWLRTFAANRQAVVSIYFDGSIIQHGYCVKCNLSDGRGGGVRPVLWISNN